MAQLVVRMYYMGILENKVSVLVVTNGQCQILCSKCGIIQHLIWFVGRSRRARRRTATRDNGSDSLVEGNYFCSASHFG